MKSTKKIIKKTTKKNTKKTRKPPYTTFATSLTSKKIYVKELDKIASDMVVQRKYLPSFRTQRSKANQYIPISQDPLWKTYKKQQKKDLLESLLGGKLCRCILSLLSKHPRITYVSKEYKRLYSKYTAICKNSIFNNKKYHSLTHKCTSKTRRKP